MYICICKSITQSQILKIIEKNRPSSIQDIQSICDAGKDCGTCIPDIIDLLDNN